MLNNGKEVTRHENAFHLFTSISPRLTGNELEYQRACVASWLSAGFRIATVNGRSEVSRVAALGLDIQIIPSSQDNRPLILDILFSLNESRCRYAGIINADCALLPYPGLLDQLKKGVDGTLLYVERIDLNSCGLPQPDTCQGFDAFFFDTAIISKAFDHNFLMGAPWWDYYFPLAAVARGVRIANLETPLLTHKLHDHTWLDEEWERVGQNFWHFLKEWRSSDQRDFRMISPRSEEFWAKETLSFDQLVVVGTDCFQWLRSRRLDSPLQFLPPPMEPIEQMLRSGRVSLNVLNDANKDLLGKPGDANKDFQIDVLNRNVLQLKQVIASMEQTTSWRVTRPLRQLRSRSKRMLCPKKGL